MATAKLRGEGNTIEYTATAALSRGDIVDLGEGMIGVVLEESVANGETTEVSIVGIYEVTKATATDVFAAGDCLAFTSGEVAASATGIHRAWNASANGDTTAWVVINSFGNNTTV